jgi:hypothetical protein
MGDLDSWVPLFVGLWVVLLQEMEQSRAYNARIVEETAKLTALEERSDKQAELQRLKNLVLLNESLKTQVGNMGVGVVVLAVVVIFIGGQR